MCAGVAAGRRYGGMQRWRPRGTCTAAEALGTRLVSATGSTTDTVADLEADAVLAVRLGHLISTFSCLADASPPVLFFCLHPQMCS